MNIPVYRLPYSNEDISFVKEKIESILKSGYLTDGGPIVKEFEDNWSLFVKSKYSISTNSCTTGLQSILNYLNIENNSVIVPNYTFYATPMSVINENGKVIFCDISKDTLSISLKEIKKKVRSDTKAIIIVHVGGVISDEIFKIKDFCDKNNIFLIEDAACAAGSSIDGKKAGTLGHASVFSLHHSKVLTTGEGGMICTNDQNLYKSLKQIRSIGLDRSINNWEVFRKGSNYKMSEISASLGLLHLKKSRKIIKERQYIANFYNNNINFCDKVKKFSLPKGCKSSYYKYIIKVSNKEVKNHIKNSLFKDYNISLPPNIYDYNCNKQNFSFNNKNILNEKEFFKNSEYMSDHHFCLNMFNGITKDELIYITKSLNKVIYNL